MSLFVDHLSVFLPDGLMFLLLALCLYVCMCVCVQEGQFCLVWLSVDVDGK